MPPAWLSGLPGSGSCPPISPALVWASPVPTLPMSELPSTGEQAGAKAQMLLFYQEEGLKSPHHTNLQLNGASTPHLQQPEQSLLTFTLNPIHKGHPC